MYSNAHLKKTNAKDYMKSKYYTTLAAIGIFACAAQADISNIYGGLSDTDATEIKTDAGNLDVVLNPNQTDPSANAFFKGNGNTIGSLKTSDTPANWNIASGKTTIDINKADSGEVDAFVNTGSMIFGNGTALEIVNSAGNSAIANVDLGTLSLESSTSQYHGLSFKTNANVTGTSFSATLNSYNTPAISVSNNSTVDYRVSENSFTNKPSISVEQGSTLNVYGKFNTESQGIRFKVGGTFNYNSSYIAIGGANITGTFTAQQIEFRAGTSTLSGNGVINATGPIYVARNLTISDNATVNLKKETAGVKSKIILNTNGYLTISAKNAISYEGGLADIRVSGTRNAATLIISADNKFNKLIFNTLDYCEYLNLTVNNGATLFFNAIEIEARTSNTATLTINKFSEFSIFFKDISGWDEIYSVALSDIDGNKYTKDDLKWIAGKYDGIDGYWLSTVPEPATYAAVFGTLALALAIYRRRK